MSWKLKGSYVETCSCELMCPCNLSMDHGATYDFCRVVLAFNIREGRIDDTDVAGRLSRAARASLVGRRDETLDELERRDPAGFARWLAAGPNTGSDPADFVRGGPAQRGPVADTDAA